MTDCIFCGIASGHAEAARVYADERVVGFLDIKPVTRGHALLVPRAHGACLSELDPDDGAALFRAGMVVAAAQRRALQCGGVNFLVCDGAAAGQTEFHVHLHVVPRDDGDGWGFKTPPDYRVRERAELDDTAEQIRSAL